MALKYKLQARIDSMTDNMSGVWGDGSKPVMRYSDLRANAYPPRGGASDEIAFLKGADIGLGAGGLNNKLSDMRVGATSVWIGAGSSSRFDQASREMFEGGDAK